MPPRNHNNASYGQFAGSVPPERRQSPEPTAPSSPKAPPTPYRWNFPSTPTANGSQNIQQGNSTSHQFQWSRSAAMQPQQVPQNMPPQQSPQHITCLWQYAKPRTKSSSAAKRHKIYKPAANGKLRTGAI